MRRRGWTRTRREAARRAGRSDSSLRSPRFIIGRGRDAYDLDAVGWFTYDVEANPDIDARWIYDTSAPGYSNAGHTFGDTLSDDDRRALLEYLKTL